MTKNINSIELLKRHFDIALETPDGIKKLRELILALAMQGKLVPQDPNDQPASERLKEIEAEKNKLIKEGKIKRQEPLPPIKPDEIPYEIPKGWEWVRIKDITYDWGQKKPDKKFLYIDVGSIDNKKGAISSNFQILESYDAPSRARKIVKMGTVIYSTVRPYLLNIAIVSEEYKFETIASTAFAIMHPYNKVCNKFIYYYLHSNQFIKFVESKMKGVAYPAINDGDFYQGEIPLPPFAEQKLIVKKVDELMALCDKLEAERTERNKMQVTVHTSAINALLTASDKKSFNKSWQFMAKNFNQLYSVTQNVDELKKAILQLAVMGKLVPQDPKDQPASELLKEIETERNKLVKEGKIKKQEPLLPIKPEEVPYRIPKGWEWVNIGRLIYLISGQHLKPGEYNSVGDGFSYYTGPADFGSKYPTASRWTRVERAIAIKNDILLTVKGAGVGKTNKVIEEKVAISRQLMALRSISIDNYFLLVFLNSIFNEFQSLSVGIAIPGISRDDVMYRKFPLPPLAEQKRIVKKVDELMALCDKLTQHIKNSSEKKTEILNSILAQIQG